MARDSGIPTGNRGPASDLRGRVRQELDRLKGLAERFSLDEIRQGDWFPKLLKFSLDQYVQDVDAETFTTLYPGLSPQAMVAARTDLAARYASIEGALMAGAYNGALAATVGSRGAAAAVTMPAAGASFVLDLLFMSSQQLRLAYDIAVISGVPLDLDDPEDLWRLTQVAFVIKGRAERWEALARRAPSLVRPVLLNILAGDTSVAPKSLSAMGRLLLERQLLKFAIPGVGLPLSIAVNPWLATMTGNQATALFRREARILGTARRITGQAVDHSELLWVLWLIVKADGVVHDNERLLLKHVAALVGDLNSELSALAELDLALDFDHRPTATIPAFGSQDKEALYRAGVAAAAVDGSIDVNELSRLEKIAAHCSVTFDANAVRKLAAAEARAT